MELITFPIPKSLKRLCIAPIGDIQWSGESGPTAKDQLRRHIDKCLEMDAYFIGLGDYIDFMCVELDAEILTQRGWKTHNDAVIGELVAAFDGEVVRWVPLLRKHYYDSAPVVEMKSKSFQARVTPSHKWFARPSGKVRSKYGKKPGLYQTKDIVGKAFNLKIAAPAESGTHCLTADEAWLIGWLITDGCISWMGKRDNFCVLQSKMQYVDELRERLGPMIRREAVQTFPHKPQWAPQYCFDLNTDMVRAVFWRAGIDYTSLEGLKELPLVLSTEAREAMLDALLKAEGTFQGEDETRVGNWRFSQSATVNPIVCEVFQNLCVMLGLRLGISKPKTNDVWTPRILKRDEPTTYDMTSTNIGARPVWCPETEFGTWIMRQGDQIAITGNSPSNRQRLISAGLYDTALAVMSEKANDLMEEVFEQFLQPTVGRWLFLLEGHHFFEGDGETTDERLAAKLKTKFVGTSVFARIPRANLTLYAHHGTGGGTLPGSGLNKLYHTAAGLEGADLYFLGHNTKMATARLSRPYPAWDSTPPKLIHRDIWIINSGGFSKSNIVGHRVGTITRGDYAEQGMMTPSPLSAPIVTVDLKTEHDRIRVLV